MLEEVVYNLCDNAIRYNNEGGKVDVTVKPVKGKIYLCVEDNGIGISKGDMESLEGKFDAVIFGVAHNEFKDLDARAFLKAENGVVYDVKGILPKNQIDGRL